MSTINVTIPNWLDFIFTCPLLLYRLLRFGYTYRRIYLGEERFAILDQRDYYRLSKFKWYLTGYDGKFYAVRNFTIDNIRTKIISMHRELINAPKGLFVDHKNGNSLDNRKSNLRLATRGQNLCNSKRNKDNCTSKYRGVSWSKRRNKWRIGLQSEGKCVVSRLFANEIDAAKAYDEAAKKYHGEFAQLNFPNENQNIEIRNTKYERRTTKYYRLMTFERFLCQINFRKIFKIALDRTVNMCIVAIRTVFANAKVNIVLKNETQCSKCHLRKTKTCPPRVKMLY